MLLGGVSAEREISLRTGSAVCEALRSLGYAVTAIEVQADGGWLSQARQVDVVFIALHGKFGEDGTVQAVLEVLGIPYTGSGVLASALAMNKPMAKRIWHTHGIPTPAWEVIDTRAGGQDAGYAVVSGCGQTERRGLERGGEYRALQPRSACSPGRGVPV